ncbi:MAG: OFA family MFS transporter [Thermodesulfobacteriota bacterium]|nr:OFA family MFS transporter [Thermodesulfobacteriota bacterium]
MSERQDVMNRWWVVIGAVAIQLCLGAIYAWSVFTPKLTDPNGIYAFSTKQAMWVFSLGLFVFAVVMVISGRLQAKYGPRILAVSGGIVLGSGYILGGLLGNSFVSQMVFIGLLGGAGIGLAYVVPIAVGVKWFPDKKGLITGLAVAGFGFGALIWVKSAGSWFGLLDKLNFFGLGGVQSVFLLYGIIFMIMVLLGSIVMVDPPRGWLPEGYTPPDTNDASASLNGAINFDTGEMLKTPQFYMTFLTFLLSALAGLMVIGCIKLFGIDALSSKGISITSASAVAGTAMAFYAIFNGLGRIVWGSVSDTIGRRLAIFLMCALQGIIMALFYKFGSISLGLIVCACIIGFNFGGNFALFPAITADYFGNTTIGKNYGWVFLAYGFAGIVGPQIAGYFKDIAQASGTGVSAWSTPFVIASASCILGAVITLVNKPPKKA